MSVKQLLFSVTASDCRFEYFIGPGDGGQKRQKTASACRCTHIASGAVGKATESRYQRDNREKAFERMANTKEFKNWHKLEVARRTGVLAKIEAKVEQAMASQNIRTEVKNDQGLWVEGEPSEPVESIGE